MEIIHNNLNGIIFEMSETLEKGQPFRVAKQRKMRHMLKRMYDEQNKPITFADVWFYFKMWIKGRCSWTKKLLKT